jgi:predicted RNase H-like nuclease (RuvC/YqgF family)
MNKTEIAEALRQEVGELEVAIKKLQARCDKLKKFVLNLEEELEAAKGPRKPSPIEEGKFREVIDRVFGEKPKRPKN